MGQAQAVNQWSDMRLKGPREVSGLEINGSRRGVNSVNIYVYRRGFEVLPRLRTFQPPVCVFSRAELWWLFIERADLDSARNLWIVA